MDARLSRAFRDLLNSLPTRERFKMQTDFATSEMPVQFAEMMVRVHGGKQRA